MLPDVTIPVSFAVLLEGFRPCFTAPTFRVFRALVVGMLAAAGRRTVCGMLVGAGLSALWPHDRAHRFFAKARWSPDQIGLALARLVVDRLALAGPLTVALDDTLFHRAGACRLHRRARRLPERMDHGQGEPSRGEGRDRRRPRRRRDRAVAHPEGGHRGRRRRDRRCDE